MLEHAEAQRDGSGRLVRIVGVVQDITARKRAEEALRENQARLETERARLQAIIDTMPVGFFIVEPGGKVVVTNDEAKRIWAGVVPLEGFSDYSEYVGYWPETGRRLDAEEWPAAQALLHGRSTKDVMVDIERFDGTRGTILVSGAPVRDAKGDDLLDVTRIAHGKIPLERSELDLRDVVRKTTGDLDCVFAQAGIELRVEHLTAGPIRVEADAMRLAQVLTNLLNNAIKFTPRGGNVRVSVAARERHAELCVTDDGIGMDPKDVDHMFEPFAQADHSLARTQGGLGLGLALVRSIVELHGGTVTARSEGRGRGAEFRVRIPLAGAGR